jgi:hypothetical protein
MLVVCILPCSYPSLQFLEGTYADSLVLEGNAICERRLFRPFPLVFRASTADVPVPPLRLPSPSIPHPFRPLPRLLLFLSLMHPPMPLQLIAPRERFPTSRFEARVLALGRVHSEVFRQVGRFRKGGGTAGEGAREGARTGVRACFWRAAGG